MNTFDNIVYPVSDLAAAKTLHRALLDTEPHTDRPNYVGFNVGGVEVGLTPRSADGPSTAIAHIRVPDIRAALDAAGAAGATVVSDPRDVGGGTLVATISDSDATLLGLIQRA